MLKSPQWTHITGNLRIITNSRLWKMISEGLNYGELRTFNLKRCKGKVIDGLDKLIKGKISSDRNITEKSLTPSHSLILEKS